MGVIVGLGVGVGVTRGVGDPLGIVDGDAIATTWLDVLP